MNSHQRTATEADNSARNYSQEREPAWEPQPPPGHPPDPNGRHPLDEINEEEEEGVPAYDIGSNAFVASVAQATADGRININLGSRTSRLLQRLIADRPDLRRAYEEDDTPAPLYTAEMTKNWTVALNIVIQVVGSRGDVQPFVALGCELRKSGHRVRLATHDVFENFVLESGLEFFPVGGDPADLMAYMVKNPGLLPNLKTLRQGDIQRKREMVDEMLDGFWASCIEPDPRTFEPFVADAIIANPPSFAHIHCAQALGIPLHMMFTMPWSGTKAFPHPLANILQTTSINVDVGVANYLSYGIVEWMTWQGLGDVINKWRDRLDLEPVPMTEGPSLIESQQKPFTYCWSPALVAKPRDWPAHIDVCGFFFRETPRYEPPSDLQEFLNKGSTPVYIGFGSIVIDDPVKLNNTILEAVASTGARAIVSKGWANLGQDDKTKREDIFYLGDCPHEWLFQQVAAVVHHGGAGTTACGLFNGVPTTIVPFFGDQPFWGNMVAAAGAGPKPIHHKALNAANLAEAIAFCLTPEAKQAAMEIAEKMRAESGVKTAVESFHRNLPLVRLPCDLQPHLPAVWLYRTSATKRPIKLSNAAAETLIRHNRIEKKHLKIYQSDPIMIERRRYDILTGFCSSIVSTAADLVSAIGGVVLDPVAEHKRVYKQNQRTLSRISSMQQSRASSPTRSTHSTPVVPLFNPEKPVANRASALAQPPYIPPSRSNTSTSGGTPSIAESSLSFKARNHHKAAALASARSAARIPHAVLKGAIVTAPSAIADGMRSMPRLIGDNVKDHDPITDWKSGVYVGGKEFVTTIFDTVTGVVVAPYKGYKEGMEKRWIEVEAPDDNSNTNNDSETLSTVSSGTTTTTRRGKKMVRKQNAGIEMGIMGAAGGLGKWAVGIPIKICGAMLGIAAYPLQGGYKSLYTLAHSGTQKRIAEMRLAAGKWLVDEDRAKIDVEALLKRFDEFRRKGGSEDFEDRGRREGGIVEGLGLGMGGVAATGVNPF